MRVEMSLGVGMIGVEGTTMLELKDRLERKRGTRREPGVLTRGCAFEETQRFAEELALLAHPVRLHILELLAQNGGQVCVCDLEAALPVKQPTISHHLRILRNHGLIEDERDGLWVYYSVRKDRLDDLRRSIAQRLARLG